MEESPTGECSAAGPDASPYDARRLSYANTFDDPVKATTIRAMEWATGKRVLLRLIRRFEENGPATGQGFWRAALDQMGIEIGTPLHQLDRIPREGPLVIVANHPHGLVDGMVLAHLVGQVRRDYRILVRSLLAGVPQVEQFLIPVPFPHEADARRQNLAMRRKAMAHLARGGALVLFPAGAVACSETLFGPAREAPWTPFTGNLIQRTGARAVPVHFPGANSRGYQIAARLSPTLRQGMLLHEVVHALGRPQAPVIGPPFEVQDLERWSGDPRGLVAHLREATLALGEGPA